MNFKYCPYSDELVNNIFKNHKDVNKHSLPPIINITEPYTLKNYEPVRVRHHDDKFNKEK